MKIRGRIDLVHTISMSQSDRIRWPDETCCFSDSRERSPFKIGVKTHKIK